MVVHIVLFKWKPEASRAEIEEALKRLRELPSAIPDLLSLSCGENFSARSQGFTHALVAYFQDRAGLEKYRHHPDHQKIVEEMINPMAAQILAADFETPDNGKESG